MYFMISAGERLVFFPYDCRHHGLLLCKTSLSECLTPHKFNAAGLLCDGQQCSLGKGEVNQSNLHHASVSNQRESSLIRATVIMHTQSKLHFHHHMY